MKKKIISLCLVVALVATAIAGATLAWFQDTDAQTNTFTVGNVKIDLFEDFNNENIPLVPAVGSTDPATGYATYKNTIEKEVYVENEGSEEAYVRVHIAIPDFQRDGKNISVIGFTYDEFSTVNNKWIWGTTVDANYPIRDGGEWNMYRDIKINNVPYKVYVVTYETALNKGDITVDAINKVFMDPAVTNEEVTAWTNQYGSDWQKVYVVAEAVQADGFSNAIEALNAAFGDPQVATGETSGRLTQADFLATAENDTFVERTAMNGN